MLKSPYFMVGVATGALAAFLLFAAKSAPAQEAACAPASEVIAQISGDKYREKPAFTATLSGSRLPIVVYANPETGTWTVLRLHPPGMACIVGAGRDFKAAPAEAPGEPA